MNLVPDSILLVYVVVDRWPVLLFRCIFDMFLEKNKLKDDSSNDAEWIRDLRIILIAAQKNYVLDVPLGDGPIAGVDADIMNVWQARYDDYLIV